MLIPQFFPFWGKGEILGRVCSGGAGGAKKGNTPPSYFFPSIDFPGPLKSFFFLNGRLGCRKILFYRGGVKFLKKKYSYRGLSVKKKTIGWQKPFRGSGSFLKKKNPFGAVFLKSGRITKDENFFNDTGLW